VALETAYYGATSKAGAGWLAAARGLSRHAFTPHFGSRTLCHNPRFKGVQTQMPKGRAKKEKSNAGSGNGTRDLLKELWGAAVNMRGSIEPADYKRYVLPIIFLRFLSLRYERRRAELEALIEDPKSDLHTTKAKEREAILNDPDEYRRARTFIVPELARWKNLRAQAPSDNIRTIVDDALQAVEDAYPDKLKGLLPRIYAASNLQAENVTGLINLFSKDIFEQDHGGMDLEGDYVDCIIQLSGQLFANTQIPCSLWFLSNGRKGGKGQADRRGKVLFIDGRKLGSLIIGSRKQKELSLEEIERMAAAYRAFKRSGSVDAMQGFCRAVTLQDVASHHYALTPGRYVGSEDNGDDEGESFEIRMQKQSAVWLLSFT
jgi:type I restriction-modification system DNA methylase subunit